MEQTGYAMWNSGVPRGYLKALSDQDMITEADGVRVKDVAGRWYLDARSGLWNVTLGYSNERVIDAIKQQLDRLPFGNIYGYGRPSLSAHQCSQRLVEMLPEGLNMVRFSSNGAQAVENAILLSRFLRNVTGQPQRNAVFSMWHGFHGLGPGAGAVTGVNYLHRQTGPLLPDIHHAPGPFHSMGGTGSDLERVISDFGPERVTAVIIEPVVGEGGHVLSLEYLQSLQRFCREHDIHLVFDEIVTGMGRVGAITRAEQVGISPDILTLGKGITSGYVPLSAVAIHDRVYEQLRENTNSTKALSLGSTNDGHPLATAAALAVLDVLTQDGVLDNVKVAEAALVSALERVRDKHPEISAIRGTGLICGLEFAETDGTPWTQTATNSVRMAMESRGVLVSSLRAAPQLMLVPPLVITEQDAQQIASALDGALTDVKSGVTPKDGFARAMG